MAKREEERRKELMREQRQKTIQRVKQYIEVCPCACQRGREAEGEGEGEGG